MTWILAWAITALALAKPNLSTSKGVSPQLHAPHEHVLLRRRPSLSCGHRDHVSLDQLKVMRAFERSRTTALSGHVAHHENEATFGSQRKTLRCFPLPI